jgi:tagatose-6-phosphate ketose/aldose isomerase
LFHASLINLLKKKEKQEIDGWKEIKEKNYIKVTKRRILCFFTIHLAETGKHIFMKYLGLELPALIKSNAVHTAREISQQPDLWQTIWREMVKQRSGLEEFMDTALSHSTRIILTGAGTSAFIGLSLSALLQRNTGIITQAIASTDLVSHPRNYFVSDVPTLLISFARSGNSPESVAAVALADEICNTCFHLIITCNPQGELARLEAGRNKFVFSLPPEANDQSLAMTSSYTGMLLSGILIAQLHELDAAKKSIDVLTGYGRKIIDYYATDLARIAEKDFTRAVFLGSGPFFGTAKESHLKVQELTDGRIICKEDSFLGFRHGPKAVIDQSTLVVYILSNQEYVSKYERDLIYSMKKGHPPMMEIGIMESVIPNIELEHVFHLASNGVRLSEEYLSVCCALPAQILGFYKSLQLGLRPDMPSATGAITRVVEGVQIYDLNQ